MKELEIMARNEEEASAQAVEQSGIAPEFLEIIEEYEPDEIDCKEFAAKQGLDAPPDPSEYTLYIFRVAFEHYRIAAEEWVGGLIERFAPGSTATAVRFRDIIILQLEVPDPSILIGKQGATLDSLQHVTVRALLTLDPDFPDIMLDVERYREKKLIRLEKEARRAADRALRNNRKISLSPMSPAERKFIHNCLKDVEGIETESEGEGRDRHIVVKSLRRGGRGGGGGGRGRQPHPQYGHRPPPPGDDAAGSRITEEQRQLLYGAAQGDGEDEDEDESGFEDQALEERSSILPRYQDDEEDAASDEDRRKLADEIE